MREIKVIAIIPARAGSKRLPGKNIKSFCGKPLIYWTIKAAQESKYVDKVVVTTDSKEIINFSKNCGVDYPLLRPNELSSDESSSEDVVNHVLRSIENISTEYDYLILLQPTSPLRSSDDIDKSIDLLIQRNAESVTSVVKLDHPVEWSSTINGDYKMTNFLKNKNLNKQSQFFPTKYLINGAIFLINVPIFLKDQSFISSNNSYAYIMNKITSVDIDNQFDFDIAEIYMKYLV